MAVKAVVFDLYGTLLNIESMRTHVAAAGVGDADAFVAYWRRKQLEYAWLQTIAGAYTDFESVTLAALLHACEQLRCALEPDRIPDLLAAWCTMPAYPDVADALRVLAAREIPRAVLTNGTPDSANAALEHAGLRGYFADVLSVEAVRAYKPDPRVYALATQRFGCEPREIAFVSSNAWDAWGANAFGFTVAWCNRARNAKEYLGTTSTMTVLSGLHELERFVVGSP